MVKKTTNEKKSGLMSWFLSAPVKFALLAFGTIFAISIIYSLIKNLMFGNSIYQSPEPLMAAVLIGIVFSICMLIKWLPNDNLDRRSFVAVDTGLTVLYFTVMLASVVFLLSSLQNIMFYIMWLQTYSLALFFITAIVGSLIYLYVLGLMVAGMYGVYLRSRAMGIAKWKVILSLPFTFGLLWMPGYLLPDEDKAKPVITIKSKWYSAVVNWIISKPINAILVLAVVLAISLFIFNSYFAYGTAFFALMFGVWLLITGAKAFRKNIGGVFATVSAALNIVLILAAIGYAAFSPRVTMHQYAQPEQVQVMNDSQPDSESDSDYDGGYEE